jgi:murein DD-endopeptidase MepM/ murein hydrolase activator NlpD
MPARTPERRSPERWRRALKRPLLAVAALAVVALTATACIPPADPAPPATTAQATIVHCPVVGFTYNQGFGPTHSGVDMGAPYGSNVYAVRNGTLWYWSTGDVGGYSVYLKADDGNTYYYTHLRAYASALENTTRPVKAGDVIEFVDHTGNANGFDHLHFEVRLGGPNGTRVDPRPTLDAAGCA